MIEHKKCEHCKGTGKILIYPDGKKEPYMPAIAMDSHHKGVRVAVCQKCLGEGFV